MGVNNGTLNSFEFNEGTTGLGAATAPTVSYDTTLAPQLFSNNGVSTLQLAITSSATSLAVQDADAGMYPQPDPTLGQFYLVTLDDGTNIEILKVTVRYGASMAIERGYEGTTPRAWPAGTKVELRWTAESMTQLGRVMQEAHWLRPVTTNAMDDYFEGVYDPTKWAWVNQQSCTVAVADEQLVLTAPNATTTMALFTHTTALPASGTTWRVRTRLSRLQGDVNDSYTTLIVRDTVSSRFLQACLSYSSGRAMVIQRWNSPTSFNSAVWGPVTFGLSAAQRGWYFEWKLDSVADTIELWAGFDRRHLVKYYSEGRTAFLTNGPNQAGFGIASSGATTTIGAFDFFQRDPT